MASRQSSLSFGKFLKLNAVRERNTFGVERESYSGRSSFYYMEKVVMGFESL